MARRSYKQMALEAAQPLGITVQDEGDGVEVWTFGTGFCLDAGSHTTIPQKKDFPSEAALYRYIYELVDNVEMCENDCYCWTTRILGE